MKNVLLVSQPIRFQILVCFTPVSGINTTFTASRNKHWFTSCHVSVLVVQQTCQLISEWWQLFVHIWITDFAFYPDVFKACEVDCFLSINKILTTETTWMKVCPLLRRWRGVCLGPQWLQPAGQWHHQPRTDPGPGFHQPPWQESDRGGLWLPPHDRPHNWWRGNLSSVVSFILLYLCVALDSEHLSLCSGVRVGLQQLRPSRFRVDCQPADTTPGQQLSAEQSGG